MSASVSEPSEAPPRAAEGAPCLRVARLSKAFGPTRALAECDLAVGGGEIRALLGENGSGKSTLVKILSGVLSADSGEVAIAGAPFAARSPRGAQAAGVATVFQETLVAPSLPVRENVFLGGDGLFRRARSRESERARARALLAELGAGDADPEAPAGTLALDRRQVVTIARALARPWRLLILDEATSALDVETRDALFAYLRRARSPDSAVLFITHRMDEIAEIADTVTVLRSGRTTETLRVGETSADALVERLSGSGARRDSGRPQQAVAAPAAAGEVALRATGLRLRAGGAPLDLGVHAGEILGLGGLDGHGQAAFLAALGGWKPAGQDVAGTVEAASARGWRRVTTPRQAGRLGICYVPRERKAEGLFPGLAILDNYGMLTLSGHARAAIVARRSLRRAAHAHLGRLNTRFSALGESIDRLSGGNQQKVLLARWLAMAPRVMLLNDPLRGVDAATKAEIYEVFRTLAAEGVALVFLSTEIEELLAACDRLAVFREEEISATLERGALSHEAILAAMFGGRRTVAAQ